MDEPVKVNQTSPNDDEIHLLDYLIVLAKHSRMIVYTTAAVTAFTLLFLLVFVPNKYTATARLLQPQQNMTLSAQLLDSLGVGSAPGANMGGGLGGMAANLLGLKSPGDIYIGILNGNTIYDRMIQRFDLKKYYFDSSPDDETPIEDVRKVLNKSSDIEVGKDGLIIIAVTDEDPKKAAEMTNAFGEELDRLMREISKNDARNQLAFLEAERTQTSLNLAKAEEALRCFSEKTNVIQIDAQTKGMLEYIANLRAMIDAKEVQVKVMQQQASANNFDLVRLETEVGGLKDKLRGAETQMDQKAVGDLCITGSKVPSLGLDYLRLYREAKYQEIIYQMYSKLVELARLDTARNVATIQFVDRATPPEKKSKPKRLIISLLIGFVTFFSMIVFAFIREFWQRAATQEDQVVRLKELRYYLQPWRRIPKSIWAKIRKGH